MKYKIVLIFLLFTIYAFAGNPKFKFSEMVNKSDLIVKARVLSAESAWKEDSRGRHIYTTATLSVEKYIKGNLQNNQFSLEIPGGKVGDITEVVSTSFGIQKDEEVILFLNNNPLRPSGYQEAKMTLHSGNVFLNTKYIPADKFISYLDQVIKKPVEIQSFENIEQSMNLMDIRTDVLPIKQDAIDTYKQKYNNKNDSKLLLANPDLAPYLLPFFADKITIKKTTITDPATQLKPEDSPIYDTDNLYLAIAIANFGSVASGGYSVRIFLDGAELTTVTNASGTGSMLVSYWYNISIGSITQGNHTLRMVADCFGTVAEGDETNNEYSRNITVLHTAGGASITSMSPASGSAGTNSTVTITGSGFGATQGSGSVEFFYRSGQPKISAAITSWSDNQIVCDIPIGTVSGYPGSAASGPVTVVTNGGVTSNGYSFTVTFGYGGTKWSGAFPAVQLRINENYAGMASEGAAVQAAASTWTGAGANFAFQYAGTSTATGASADGVNTICWGTTSGSLATAYYWFSGSNMAESDIVFNETWTWTDNGTGYDVQGIALHELGHWLNLRDLYGSPNSSQVMYGFGSPGEVKRSLTTGDQEGIVWIYGSGGPPPIPTAPTLSSPADGQTGTATGITLQWNASSGATTYGLQVSTNSSFTALVHNLSGITLTQYSITGLSNSTTYYWRANATNSSGTSGWSSYRSFTTITSIPSAPVLSSPTNGQTDVSTTPTLSWNASGGATSYQLKVATDAGFSGIVFNQSGITSTSQALTGLNYNTTYYWQVNATNVSGSSSFSSAWSFTTMPATYTMQGTVTLGGAPLSGVVLSLSGTTTGSYTTETNGNYTFTGNNGGNYTITPSKANHTFTPASQTFNPLNSNKTQNFAATLITYSISGVITNNGAPLSGVIVTLTGTTSASATTAANGSYSFTGLTAGGNYTVTPAKTNYSFSPVSQTYNSISENKTLNFTSLFITYSIRGTVTSNGASLFGVTLNLTGSSTATTTSIENGDYTFAGLLPGGNYTVTPVMANYVFSPANQAYTSLNENKTLNFEASPIKYSITGILTSNGQPLANTTVALTGSSTASAITNASGAYTFSGLNPGGSFTVTPSKSGYTFAPTNAVFNNISENKTQNFTGTAVTYSITGSITSEGASLSGVTISLSGSSTGTTTSIENGSYTLSGLLAAGSYTITPSLTNYSFAPVNAVFNNLAENKTQNFSGTINKFTISGLITVNGIGLSGVNVTLSGSKNSSITTGADGSYSFSSLNAGGNYIITPVKENYSFTPLTGSFNNLLENKTQNFTGAYTGTFSISGLITANGIGLGGVTLTLSGSSSGTTTTASNGSYTFAGLPTGGNYTIVPAKENYTFSPLNAVFNGLNENKIQNFSGTANLLSISGLISVGGSPLSGVTISLSGSSMGATTSDAAGAYTFNNLNAGGNYTVTPAKANYTFTPINGVFNNLSENKIQNFSASINKFSISGSITVNGQALSGVILTLSGDKSATFTTGADGAYLFTELNGGGNYTITPVKTNYAFTPINGIFSNLAENKIQNFTAVFSGTFSLSGIVSLEGNPLSGVTIALSGGSSATTTTASNGTYTFSGLAAGGNFTITPSKENHSFSPVNASFTNLAENKTQNFAATLNTYSISGIIRSGSSALSNVTVTLSGALSGSQVTNSTGNYVFNNLPAGGNYALTPSRTNYKFEPVNKTFNLLNKNETQDFTGSPLSEVNDYENGKPGKYSLAQNYPNPFNPGTRIDFTIPENTFITIKIFNSLGIEIETLLERSISTGEYSISWNPADHPSGVYYYSLRAGKFFEMKKMLYLR